MVNGKTKVSDLTVEELEQILSQINVPSPSDQSQIVMDASQACEFLDGMSKDALYYRCMHNVIPHIRKGRKLYFIKDVLAQWKIQNIPGSKEIISSVKPE
jgi:hypothetical protein